MIILGIDPGVHTGYALLDQQDRTRRPELVLHGTVNAETGTLAERLVKILTELVSVIGQADVAVVEVPSRITYRRSEGTYGKTLNAESMGLNNRITGAIIGQLALAGVKVIERESTWSWQNKASKGATVKAFYKDLGPSSEHSRDAILIALTYNGR